MIWPNIGDGSKAEQQGDDRFRLPAREVDGMQHRYRSWMQRSATRSSASGFGTA